MTASTSFVSVGVTVFLLFTFFGEHSAKLVTKTKSPDADGSVMLRKIQRLVQLMDKEQGKGSIEITLKDYRETVFESPRNHTAFVLFYNDDDLCASCGVIRQAFDKIARSFVFQYTKFDKQTSTWNLQVPAFFVKIKMSEGYRHMLVDVEPSSPSLFYFAPAPSSKYNPFEEINKELLEVVNDQFRIERMLGFIEHSSNLRIPLQKDAPRNNWISSLFTGTALCIMIMFNIYHFGYWNYFIEAIKHGNHAYFITVIVIWFLSGQMFNYIRYTPMFGNHGFSVMSLIYPGMRGQYDVMILYAITGLIETRERQLNENLPLRDVQGSILGALSGFYFGFMGLQFISQIKSGR